MSAASLRARYIGDTVTTASPQRLLVMLYDRLALDLERAQAALAGGDRVTHDSFGLGTVVTVEGAGEKAVASIDFGSQGVKRLLLRYAPVEKL